jgi:hypothetical protein
MINDSLVSLAFRQFASMIEIEKVLAEIASPNDLKVWFLRLPWDEKAFKVKDDRISTDVSDGSAGNWLARVCKDGPRLVLTPTVNVFSKGTVIAGARFWRHLTAALNQTYNGFQLGRTGGPLVPALAAAAGLGLDRWDKAHFHKWTRPPAPVVHQDDARNTEADYARQAYSMFYQ